jgi:hypothetical protein
VKSLAKGFQHRREGKARQFRLLNYVFRNRFGKRPRDVFRGDGIGHDRFNRTGAERFERRLAVERASSKPMRDLERSEGLAGVLSASPVDLSRRKVGSIEKDLHFERCGSD